MLHKRKNAEAIIFIIIPKGDERLSITKGAWPRTCNRWLKSRCEKLFHDFKIFFFCFGTDQKRLGFGFLGKEGSLGFNVFNAWGKKASCGEPFMNNGFGQFWLFIKFWPPLDFNGSL